MSVVLLNVGSFALGLIAWILPIILLVQHNRIRLKTRVVLVAASLGACAASLCLQIFEMNRRVVMQDWSALMDTSGAVAGVSLLLLIGTVLLTPLHWRHILRARGRANNFLNKARWLSCSLKKARR